MTFSITLTPRISLVPLHERIRDVQQSPDGYIYVVTEQASAGNATDGLVLRIEPANQ